MQATPCKDGNAILRNQLIENVFLLITVIQIKATTSQDRRIMKLLQEIRLLRTRVFYYLKYKQPQTDDGVISGC